MIKKVFHTNNNHKIEKRFYKNLVVLAIGSNIGDKKRNLQRAIKTIPFYNKVSADFYATPALLPNKHYVHWNKPYLNTVVCGYCNLSALALLNITQKIEKHLGRVNNIKWAPRIIDIDIIFYKNARINTKKLSIPHKEMRKRNFVLKPLNNILPEYFKQ